MLDAVGDLFLGGYSIIGEVTAYKSGHALNNMLIRELLQNQEAWEFVTFEDTEEAPVSYMMPSLA